MPELPDVEVYREAVAARVMGEPVTAVHLDHPFVLRTAVPPITEVENKRVRDVRRLGKRIVLGLDDALFIVLHLMIAGRLLWLEPGGKAPRRITLARLEFPRGMLVLTEAGSKRRASIHLVRGAAALAAFDPGGLDVLASDLTAFAARLRGENHTLKRALTDPHILSGIGNAYSDEILHRAKLSPLALTTRVTDAELARLHAATRAVLSEWTARLRTEAGGGFPVNVTAFRPEMAVHGRYRQPCPACGAPVQRIVYAENECNYCARCQTGGRLLADRSLSRLLKASWPRSLDDA